MTQSLSIPWLDACDLTFPDIDRALDNPSGLLAVGGDLSPARLLEAYRHGIFPWYEDPQPILWWSPEPRAVLYPDDIYINRNLRKTLNRGDFRVTLDQAFVEVLECCAELSPKRPGTWITEDMKAAYRRMHELGWAHSVEVWREDRLIGGLYGLAIGKIFFGESMFSRETNGSKIALVSLCSLLRDWRFALIDCQVGNDYLYSMGAKDISREQFRSALETHARTELSSPGTWALPIT
jgi:leucyl/phenylalanyl-tRNA---protein transferase